MCGKLHHLQELTIKYRISTDQRRLGRSLCFFDPLEEHSTIFHILRNPELLVDVDRAQSFRSRLFKSMLLVPISSLLLHRITQEVYTIVRVRLGVFNVGLCIVEPAFIAKQPRQFVMDPKSLTLPVERGSNSESWVNGLLGLALRLIYIPEDSMRIAGHMLFAFLWGEIDRAECGFFCGVELLVPHQQPSEFF